MIVWGSGNERMRREKNKCGRGTKKGEKSAKRLQSKCGKEQEVSRPDMEAIYVAHDGSARGRGGEINGKEEDTVVSRGLGSHLRFACLSFVGLVGCRCFCGS